MVACRRCSVASSARDDLLLPDRPVAPRRPAIRLGRDDARQLIEELPHVRRERRRQLLERALDIVAERRARERLEERAAEIERAQLGQREPGREPLERLAVDAPPRPPIVARSIVVEREARFLERLQVAADRARRDAAERREIVDGDARHCARTLDRAEDSSIDE